MAVHMFRCYIGRGKMSVSDLETRIDDWVTSNAEWVDDNYNHSLMKVFADNYNTEFLCYTIDVWFLLDDAKDNLVQKFADKLKDKVDWYRLGYHECGNDGINSDCSFDPAEEPSADAVQWTAKDVTIPSEMPDFPAEAY